MPVDVSTLDDQTAYELTLNKAIKVGSQNWRPAPMKCYATGEMLKAIVAADPSTSDAFETANVVQRPLGDA